MSKPNYLAESMPTEALLEAVVRLCHQAGQQIMDVFQHSRLQVDYKADDSPVTAADLAAHDVLVPGLKASLNVPLISEESEAPDFEERRQWELFWLIDPLDGTKEFISGSGEFTVNVALIRQGRPVAGVVHAPALGSTYTGLVGRGAFRHEGEERRPIRTRDVASRQRSGLPLEVVASRRHSTRATEKIIDQLHNHFVLLNKKSVGSSLKFCLIAEGQADYYPRLGPTCEWDTAAAQAVIEAAGGVVFDEDFKPLLYNQKHSLVNPGFHVVGDPSLPWPDLLAY